VSVGGEVVEGEANCVLCLFGHLSNGHYKKPSVGEVCQPGQQTDTTSVHYEIRYQCPGSRSVLFL
jgi:hypothetical protein